MCLLDLENGGGEGKGRDGDEKNVIERFLPGKKREMEKTVKGRKQTRI